MLISGPLFMGVRGNRRCFSESAWGFVVTYGFSVLRASPREQEGFTHHHHDQYNANYTLLGVPELTRTGTEMGLLPILLGHYGFKIQIRMTPRLTRWDPAEPWPWHRIGSHVDCCHYLLPYIRTSCSHQNSTNTG
ncbi:hypothetical protein LY78DRAFT_189356 [Colletotrichum sublineola]|nr:hypothetical protein LY78DRAFT_189356 [Colletotrichum sublineola]